MPAHPAPAPALSLGPATLHLGDALHFLRTLAPESIDAVITDPPYCSGGSTECERRSAKCQGVTPEVLKRLGWFAGDNMGTAGLAWMLRDVAVQARRALRKSGSLIVFCDWRMLPSLAPALESAGLRYQSLIVWDKGSAGLGTGFKAQHELAIHLTNGSPKFHDKCGSNVLSCKRVKQRERVHQTQKPVELIERMIRVVCPPEGVVADPFMGSGTTGVAALQTGRRFIGSEQSPEIFDTAAKRIAAAAS